MPEEAWREITVAEGSQGPRTYRFSAQRVRVTKRRKPGEVVWAIYRCNLDGTARIFGLGHAGNSAGGYTSPNMTRGIRDRIWAPGHLISPLGPNWVGTDSAV